MVSSRQAYAAVVQTERNRIRKAIRSYERDCNTMAKKSKQKAKRTAWLNAAYGLRLALDAMKVKR